MNNLQYESNQELELCLNKKVYIVCPEVILKTKKKTKQMNKQNQPKIKENPTTT